MRLARWLLAAVLGAAAPATAAAQPAQRKAPATAAIEEARRLFKDAVALTDVDRWDDALVKFERAAQLVPDKAAITFNIARCEKSLGRYTRARALFMKALEQGRSTDALEPDEIATARRFIAEIEPKILRVTVVLSRVDATVLVDGRPLEAGSWPGEPAVLTAGTRAPGDGEAAPSARFELRIDPGTHVFAVRRRGQSAVLTSTLEPGYKGSLELDAPEDAPPKPAIRYELVPMYMMVAAWGFGTGITLDSSGKGAPTLTYRGLGFGVGMSALGVGTLLLVDHLGRPLGYGVPQSITAGLGIGLETGAFVSVLTLSPRAPSGDVLGKPVTAGLTLGTSVAGAVLGGVLGEHIGTTPARAASVFSGAVWGGLLLGFGGGGTAGIVYGPGGSTDATRAVMALGGLGGTAVGALAAGAFAAEYTPSFARVYAIDVSGLAGSVTGLLLPVVVQQMFKLQCRAPTCPDANLFNLNPFSLLTTAAGTAIGLVIGIGVTTHMDHEVVPEHPEEPAAFVMPTAAPVQGGATFGLGGVF